MGVFTVAAVQSVSPSGRHVTLPFTYDTRAILTGPAVWSLGGGGVPWSVGAVALDSPTWYPPVWAKPAIEKLVPRTTAHSAARPLNLILEFILIHMTHESGPRYSS